MTDPEHAVERARAAVATMRAEGAYADDGVPPTLSAEPTLERLVEWSVIDPDLRDVRSTRRFGAPMTMLKRGLVRLLRQYHDQIIFQQARFNVHLLGQIRRLETRIEELEQSAGSSSPDDE